MESSLSIIAGIIILLIIVFVVRQRGATPPLTLWRLIEEAIPPLQRIALTTILPREAPGHITGFDADAMNRQVVSLHETIRFVYTIEKDAERFVHIVSSQMLRPKPPKFQIECMLVVMLVLNRQLGEAGIKHEDVSFEVNQSELGTHYIYMFLSPAQQEQLVAVINRPA